jgi:D-alanine--poly(phosphoribitol) ligase subunit 2
MDPGAYPSPQMPSHPSLNDQVRTVFTEVLNIDVPSDDTDLIDGGFLDSLALVELLVEIEHRFGVVVPLDALDVDDFRTVSRIGEVIAENGAGAA